MSTVQHIVSKTPEPFTIAKGRIEIHQLRAWADNYIWLLYDTEMQEAAVVDGPCAEPLYDWLASRPCTEITIWNTHHHHDHVGINRELIDDGSVTIKDVYGCADRAEDIPGLTKPLVDGMRVDFGDQTFDVWRTDGHVDGHLCYVHSEVVFCGDTLFAGGCGYLFDGPAKAMFDSLRRLAQLDDDVKVCCGHEYTVDNLRFAHFVEPSLLSVEERLKWAVARQESGETTLPSTMGIERGTNPFMRSGNPALAARVAALLGSPLTTELDVFAATRTLKDQKVHK